MQEMNQPEWCNSETEKSLDTFLQQFSLKCYAPFLSNIGRSPLSEASLPSCEKFELEYPVSDNKKVQGFSFLVYEVAERSQAKQVNLTVEVSDQTNY